MTSSVKDAPSKSTYSSGSSLDSSVDLSVDSSVDLSIDSDASVLELARLLKKHQLDADMLNDMICMYNSVFQYLSDTIEERRKLHEHIDDLINQIEDLKIDLNCQKCTRCYQDAILVHALQELRQQINKDIIQAIEKPSFFRKIYEMVQ